MEQRLRYLDEMGELIPTPEEVAQQAQLESQRAQFEAQQAQQRAERLAAKLRDLGIDPETGLL